MGGHERRQWKIIHKCLSDAIEGTSITGNWADVPLGKYHNVGTLTLKADSIPVSLTKSAGQGHSAVVLGIVYPPNMLVKLMYIHRPNRGSMHLSAWTG